MQSPMEEKSSTNDENDEVVREIDVYLSPEMCKHLYLLQYPLEFHEVPPTISARMKPRHGTMEIEHPLPNAIERGGMFKLRERIFDSQTVPVRTHMCLGKLKTDDNDVSSLHLVPLTRILQMRPSFQHVDDAYEDPRERERKEEEEEAKAAERRPIALQRKESERAQMQRLSSYAYKKQSEDSEEWFSLKVLEYQSIYWHALMKKIICPNPMQYVLKAGCTYEMYIQSLNYLSMTQSNDHSKHTNSLDVSGISSQLVEFMHLGWQIPYSLIRKKFPLAVVSDDKLIQALNVCCVMIRGNFCLQSKFLNMIDAYKPIRTFILLVLEEYGYVDRTRLTNVFLDGGHTPVTPEKLEVLLGMVAKKNNGRNMNEPRGWNPKIEDDHDFITNHHDLQKQHQVYWTNQKIRFNKQLRLYEADETNKKIEE